jgi:hypothetical protein
MSPKSKRKRKGLALRKVKSRKKSLLRQRREQYLDLSAALGFGVIGAIVGYGISGDLRGTSIGALGTAALGLGWRGYSTSNPLLLGGTVVGLAGAGYLSTTRPRSYSQEEVDLLRQGQETP